MMRNATHLRRCAAALVLIVALAAGALAEPAVTVQPVLIDTPILVVDATATPEASQPTLPPMQESFSALYAENPDVVGWLEMAPNIALPVVQRDNSFYLDHDFYGNSSVSGALFLDSRNTLWPADTHMAIYGHNMKNGSMFGSFNNYRKLSYLQKNPLVTFNTIYADARYVPFALFDASMTKEDPNYFRLVQFNFDEEHPFDAFLEDVRSRSFYDIPVEVGEEDSLLSLVTCSYSMDNGRFIIMCRKLREGETPEQMEALLQQAKSR